MTSFFRKNKKTFIQPVIYSLLLSIGIITGIFINPPTKSRFYQILDIVQTDYVEEPNPVELEEDAISGMLSQLDPHSSFVPAQLVEYSQRQITGIYQGIGVEFILYNDTAIITKIVPNGPSFIAGISEGDRILMVDEVKLTGSKIDRNQIIRAISGEPGSLANVKIYRKRNQRIIQTQIRRGQVPLKSIEVFYLIDKYTGLIKINSFSSNTHADFMIALNKLREAGSKNIVIDLRNNGGGLLREAIKIANEFLEKGDLITYTQGRKRKTERYRADGKGSFKEGRLLVITNRNTASASEILCGALQDNDRALIVGSRTFGKGLVQEPYRLPDGSSLKLTVARYYTASGRSIQKPYTRDVTAYRQEIFHRNDTLLQDTLDNEVYKTKYGRTVLAGGGISPDFNLTDTLNESSRYERLLPGIFNSGMLDVYIFDHIRNEVFKINKRYKTALEFSRNYTISSKIMSDIKKLIAKNPSYKNFKISPFAESLIRKYLKASLARQCFGESGYHQVINHEDGILSRIQLALISYDIEIKQLNKKK